jgi:hypothetical protein
MPHHRQNPAEMMLGRDKSHKSESARTGTEPNDTSKAPRAPSDIEFNAAARGGACLPRFARRVSGTVARLWA